MWILPSKGRPDACRKLMVKMRQMGAKANIMICVNADDDMIDEYRNISCPGHLTINLVPSGTVGCAEAIRDAFRLFPSEPWYGILSDDFVVKTDEFEERLVRAAGDWGIASANDEWQSDPNPQKSRITASVFGGKFVRGLGYLAPEGFKHLYVDDVWEILGRNLGNWRVLMDVVITHDHPMKSGADMDETHKSANSRKINEHDHAAFVKWSSERAHVDIHRLRMAMWDDRGLRLDSLRGKSVMFGLPCYDSVNPKREAALLNAVCLLTQLGVKVGHLPIIGMSIHLARNAIADAFMKSSFTDLFFIDSDMGFDAWDVVKFIAAPHPLLAGVGRKRAERPLDDMDTWCFHLNPEFGGVIPVDEHGMCEVAQVGTGFMRIRREVFDAILANDNNLLRAKDRERKSFYAKYFAWTDDGEDEISEDITFCRRYTDAGGKVWIDPTVTLRHYGNHEWSGCVRDIME